MKKTTRKKVWTAVFVILAIGVLLAYYFHGLGAFGYGILSKNAAEEKTVNLVNDYFLSEGIEAEVEDIEFKSGVYILTLGIDGDSFKVYTTYDGGYLFLSGIDVEDMISSTSGSSSSAEVVKSDVPRVELFVMSHCPYGTQIEKGIIPVVNLLGNKIDFELKFVNYAMHGSTEIYEELNQYCIQKEYPSKFIDYLSCFLEEGDGAGCISQLGLEIDSCVAESDNKFKVTENLEDESTWMGNYPFFGIHDAENEEYGIQGSPTMVINGVQVSSGRDAQSLLDAICSAFNEEPSECLTELSSDSPSAGFGFDSSGSSPTAATCG